MREHIPIIRLRNDYGDLVVRDGVILCFFMRRSHGEVFSAVWRALQIYQRAIPAGSLNWYVSPDGDMLPLDGQGWEHIRAKMLERPRGLEWLVELSEDPGEAGGYQFSYDGRKLDDPMFSHDDGATSAVAFSFPTEYLLEHGPGHLRALALELGRELPFSFGYASLAFISHPRAWSSVLQQLLGLFHRYWGLDLHDLDEASRNIGTGARGAFWLTFLGEPLLGQLGGTEGLRQRLSFPEVTFEPMEGARLLLTLGAWPDAMDTEQAAPPACYRALARLLEPHLREERADWPSLNKGYPQGWCRRLCQ
ncbi:type VI immunity family protein [Pyxidicoccus sp. 3LFB2]